MKNSSCKIRLLLVLALFLMYGCASPKFLSSEDRGKIKSVVVAIESEDERMNIIDVAEIRKKEYSKTYGGMMYGAIGGAIEALVKEGISRYKINSVIDGNIDPIGQGISGYDTKAVFNQLTLKGMSETMLESGKTNNLPVISARILSETGDAGSTDADALLRIEYRYGIGAYSKGKLFPAMTASISVESLPEKRTLMKDIWIASACENRDYTIEDYAKDGGEKYKRCFEEMVERFGRSLAGLFSLK